MDVSDNAAAAAAVEKNCFMEFAGRRQRLCREWNKLKHQSSRILHEPSERYFLKGILIWSTKDVL